MCISKKKKYKKIHVIEQISKFKMKGVLIMTTEFTTEKLLTARETSELFFGNKITYKRVLELTRNGSLPAIKIGRCYFYTLSALRDWQKRNESTPAWQKVR